MKWGCFSCLVLALCSSLDSKKYNLFQNVVVTTLLKPPTPQTRPSLQSPKALLLLSPFQPPQVQESPLQKPCSPQPSGCLSSRR